MDVVLVVIGLFISVYIACRIVVSFLFRKFLSRAKEKPPYDWNADGMTPELCEILSHDGLKLRAKLFHQPEKTSDWVILVHGYTDNSDFMFEYANHYYKRCFNVLIPDMRGHGASEGMYIGMGWHDRLDLIRWTEYLLSRAPGAQVVLHGYSMGSATALMAGGEQLPSSVYCIVADSGYTTVADILAFQLKKRFNLPKFPFIFMGSRVARRHYGYSFYEASTINKVKKVTIPIVFIHGSGDDFIPVQMTRDLYAAAQCTKELLIVECEGHCTSHQEDPEAYWGTVDSFIETHRPV